MIKISVTNISLIKYRFYDRICLNTSNSGKGLIDKIKSGIQEQTDPQKIFFLIELLKDVKLTNENSIITGTPHYLSQKISYYNLRFRNVISDKKFMKYIEEDIFFYSDYKKWKAYELAKELDVKVCPYCNRSYIFTIDTNDGRTRPQFDHFFDKATYPYLSLSFYNLVPCCSICNSSFKGSVPFTLTTHLHPYIEDMGTDIRFTIRPYNIDFINGKPTSYTIKVKVKTNLEEKVKKIEGNLKTFKIMSLYNLHKDLIDELIIKSRIYNNDYAEQLYESFKGTLFNSIEDVKRLVVSNYIDEVDYGKRPFARMMGDISLELGLV